MADRIVLFGGTFDPVHNGHLTVARALAERCGFDRITFLPAAIPPHKQGAYASAEDRLAMLRLAIAGQDIFDICDLELARRGPSYTFDTVAELRNRSGRQLEVYLAMGSDMLAELPEWHRAGELIGKVNVVVMAREPWQRRLDEVFAAIAESGEFTAGQLGRLKQSVVATPLVDISSSQVRRRLARGQPVDTLIPGPVKAYIEARGLYGSGEKRGGQPKKS